MATLATESWTGSDGSAWPSQWTVTKTYGSTASATIQSNMGQTSVPNSNGLSTYLSGMASATNTDAFITWTFGSQILSYVGIQIDSDGTIVGTGSNLNSITPKNGYVLQIVTNTTAANSTITLIRSVASATSTIGTQTLTLTAGTQYGIRFQRNGTTVQARVWATSGSEPSSWNVSGTDNGTQPAGSFGMAFSGASGTQTHTFDNLVVGDLSATTNSSTSRFVRNVDLTSLIISASGNQSSNVQTGNYTLALSDIGRVVEMNVAAINTVTIPSTSTVAFPVGSIIDVAQVGTGQTNIVAGSGVTLDAPRGTAVYAQYMSVRLRHRATNEWVISGNSTFFYDVTSIGSIVYRMRASTIGVSTDGASVASAAFEVGGVTLTSSGSGQPTWRARGMNGKPFISFNGTTNYLSLASGAATYNQPLTVCAVLQSNNFVASQEVFKTGGVEILLGQSTNAWSTYSGSLIHSTYSPTAGLQSFTGVFGAGGFQGSIEAYTNGVFTASGGGGGNGTGGDIWIGNHPSTPRYLNADVYEILVFNKTMTAADLSLLHAYVRANYL